MYVYVCARSRACLCVCVRARACLSVCVRRPQTRHITTHHALWGDAWPYSNRAFYTRRKIQETNFTPFRIAHAINSCSQSQTKQFMKYCMRVNGMSNWTGKWPCCCTDCHVIRLTSQNKMNIKIYNFTSGLNAIEIPEQHWSVSFVIFIFLTI